MAKKRKQPIIDNRVLDEHITRLQKKIQELGAEKNKFERIFSGALNGIFQAEPDGVILIANPAFVKLCGYHSLAQLTAVTDVGRQLFANRDDKDKLIKKLRKNKSVISFETRFQKNDGTIINVSLNASLQTSPTGEYIECFVQDITEQKQTEIQLKQTQDFTNALLDAIPTPVFYKDKEGKYLGCNRAFTEVMGVTSAEIQGKTVQELWPSDQAEVYHRKDLELLNHPQHQVYEFEVTAKDQKQRSAIFTKDVFRDEHGNVNGIVGAFVDITQRKQTEEALRESEARYRALFENAAEGILVAELNSKKFYYANPAICKMLGYTQETLIGLGVMDVHPSESLDYVLAEFNAQASGRKVLAKNIPCLRKDGQIIYADINAGKVVIQGVEYNIGFFTDITERKQAEDALRKSEHEKAVILDSVSELVSYQDHELRIIWANRAVAELNGLSIEELVGKHCYEVWPHQHEPCEDCPVLHAMLSGMPQVKEMITPDGRIWSIKGYPVKGDNGTISGAVEVTLEITERKQAEEKLREYQHELEKLVEARTSQLKAANEELEAFAYSVSHDLRAPLRAIDGFTQILLDDYSEKLNEEAKRIGAIIRENTYKMEQLIDNLLAFSRAGHVSMHFSEIDMKNLVRSVFYELTSPDERRRISFNVANLPDAIGDLNMMRQVWINLISNAIKFSAYRQQAEIQVSYRREQHKHIYSVKDNGAGFDMNYRDKLFGVFQRLHSEREFKGTGVGLALVQRIIQRHGGKVWARGEVDQGAEFSFSLPEKQ